MLFSFTFLLGVSAGFVISYIIYDRSTPIETTVKIKAPRKSYTETNKKILSLFTAKKTKITNDDVQKILGVSDATATRHLDRLEKLGKIVQKGKTRGIYYLVAK